MVQSAHIISRCGTSWNEEITKEYNLFIQIYLHFPNIFAFETKLDKVI